MGSNVARPLNDFVHNTHVVLKSALGALKSKNVLLLFIVFAGLETLRNWLLPQIGNAVRTTGPIAAEIWVGVAVFLAGGFLYAISLVVLIQVLLKEEYDDFDFLESERIIGPAFNFLAGVLFLLIPFLLLMMVASVLKQYAVVAGILILGGMLLYVSMIFFPIYIIENDVRFYTALRQSFSATRRRILQLFLLIGVFMTFLYMLVLGLTDNLAAIVTLPTVSLLVRGLFSAFWAMFLWSVIVESYMVFLD